MTDVVTNPTILDDNRGRAILFGTAPAELMDWALGDGLDTYVAWLRQSVVDVDGQLAQARAGGESADPDWRRRALVFRRQAQGALAALKPVLASQHRQQHNEKIEAAKDEKRKQAYLLRRAIWRHRERTLEAGDEVSDADKDLWALVPGREAD